MLRLLIIAQENQKLAGLCESLNRNNMACSIIPYDGAVETVSRQSPDAVLVKINDNLSDAGTWELIKKVKRARPVPIIALIPEEILDSFEGQLDADDFITSPYDVRELVLRINRISRRTGNRESSEFIKCGGLMIDLVTCEVTVESKIVDLTFKEYELLKLLASHRGRVYTREALLNRIWGYDYYGGDRTVDVHVRRLRSKIEDSNHSFIETVRNIGYRFRKNA